MHWGNHICSPEYKISYCLVKFYKVTVKNLSVFWNILAVTNLSYRHTPTDIAELLLLPAVKNITISKGWWEMRSNNICQYLLDHRLSNLTLKLSVYPIKWYHLCPSYSASFPTTSLVSFLLLIRRNKIPHLRVLLFSHCCHKTSGGPDLQVVMLLISPHFCKKNVVKENVYYS